MLNRKWRSPLRSSHPELRSRLTPSLQGFKLKNQWEPLQTGDVFANPGRSAVSLCMMTTFSFSIESQSLCRKRGHGRRGNADGAKQLLATSAVEEMRLSRDDDDVTNSSSSEPIAGQAMKELRLGAVANVHTIPAFSLFAPAGPIFQIWANSQPSV